MDTPAPDAATPSSGTTILYTFYCARCHRIYFNCPSTEHPCIEPAAPGSSGNVGRSDYRTGPTGSGTDHSPGSGLPVEPPGD